MARAKVSNQQSKQIKKIRVKKPRQLMLNMAMLSSGVIGMVVGSLAALAVVVPMANHAAATPRPVTIRPAADFSDNQAAACVSPAAQGAQPAFTQSQVPTVQIPAVNGQGAGTPPAPIVNVIKKVVLEQSASINNTGPNSVNKITSINKITTTIANETNVNISNTNNQTAQSGDAVVAHNTVGGDATSGQADNANSTSINLLLTN